MRVVRFWNRLPREAMYAPFLERGLGLRSTWSSERRIMAGGIGARWFLKVIFNSNYSVSLWFLNSMIQLFFVLWILWQFYDDVASEVYIKLGSIILQFVSAMSCTWQRQFRDTCSPKLHGEILHILEISCVPRLLWKWEQLVPRKANYWDVINELKGRKKPPLKGGINMWQIVSGKC